MPKHNLSPGQLIPALLLLVFFAGSGMALFRYFEASRDSVPSRLAIGEKSWSVIGVADTEETRALGLSHRPGLEQESGLLFVFPQPGEYGFWMKDMYFPLDIIFIRPDGSVDSVARDQKPGNLASVYPKNPIHRVFEVNAGEAARVQAGDRVEIREK